MLVQKSLSLKKYFKTRFCCSYVNPPTVKIWGQSNKFPMSFSFLQCLLQVKKCAKYVNQTSNFYFRPKLKTTIFSANISSFSMISFLHYRFHLDHYFNRKIKIWRKLSIWRYTVTLKKTVYTKVMSTEAAISHPNAMSTGKLLPGPQHIRKTKKVYFKLPW